MYLEHEELLKLVNTLEKERDEARKAVVYLADKLHQHIKSQFLLAEVDPSLIEEALVDHPVALYCREIVLQLTGRPL